MTEYVIIHLYSIHDGKRQSSIKHGDIRVSSASSPTLILKMNWSPLWNKFLRHLIISKRWSRCFSALLSCLEVTSYIHG
jgi:hypothetical protein